MEIQVATPPPPNKYKIIQLTYDLGNREIWFDSGERDISLPAKQPHRVWDQTSPPFNEYCDMFLRE
jgi:hypothetical protein